MRIVSITNQKGGCGKTTTAVNLAACLSDNGKRVLLIDLDPQAHATFGLNVKSDLSIYDVLSKLTRKKARLEDIIQNVDENFDMAPSSIVLSTLEQELAGEIGRESRLWDTMSEFSRDSGMTHPDIAGSRQSRENAGKGNYDYILIDCPPNLGILTVNAIRAADEVIIPVEASRFALEGLNQLMDIINLIKDRLNHTVHHRILVINFDSRLRHSFKMLERIKSTFPDKIFGTIIHINVKLKEAQNEGRHILNYDKYSRGAKDYFSLSREIITQETVPDVVMPLLEKKMKEILKEKLPQLAEVAFSVSAPEAKEAYVTGDFNDWKLDDNSRMSAENGTWTKKMKLTTGLHQYRFVIDGKWTEDPDNPTKETNPFGELNSLIEVKD